MSNVSLDISPRLDDSDDPPELIDITVECPLCGQEVTIASIGVVTTSYDTFENAVKTNLSVSGEIGHDCPNVTVPTP